MIDLIDKQLTCISNIFINCHICFVVLKFIFILRSCSALFMWPKINGKNRNKTVFFYPLFLGTSKTCFSEMLYIYVDLYGTMILQLFRPLGVQ